MRFARTISPSSSCANNMLQWGGKRCTFAFARYERNREETSSKSSGCDGNPAEKINGLFADRIQRSSTIVSS
jgi:hypothetical protein